MVLPLPPTSPIGALSQRVASYSEEAEAAVRRFNADWSRRRRRFMLWAVAGAVAVVGFGVWGLALETNYPKIPYYIKLHGHPTAATHAAFPAVPAGSPVMVTLQPTAPR